MPPIALATNATEDSAPIVPFVSPNSSRIGMTAKLNSRKSIASSIHPSCAANRARHARRSTARMDMSAQFSARSKYDLAMPSLIAILLLAATSQSNADLAVQVDQMMNEAVRSGPSAGASIAVVKGGQTIIAKGYGFANV